MAAAASPGRPRPRRSPRGSRRTRSAPTSIAIRSSTRWSTCRPRCRASSPSGMSLGGGRHRDDRRARPRSSAGPSSGRCASAARPTSRVLRGRRHPGRPARCRRACRRSVSPMLRPVWTIAGGDLHRGRGRRGAPAPVPRRRPRGGLRGPDLSGCRAGDRPRSGQVPQAEPVELGPARRPGSRGGRRRGRPTGSVDDVRVAADAAGLVPRVRAPPRTAGRPATTSRRHPRLTLRLTPRRAGSSSR